MMCKFALVKLIFFLFIGGSIAAKCFCDELTSEYTKDCCTGTFGSLIEGDSTLCHFRDYTMLASFNRCCDSYDGRCRCSIK
ncbi:hypothetical protein BY458DRAFT_359767 [Sporodiniella umbellata]|nr:hypothetical protein BY458DRAFT_359767 [Sporodiniella umbellata]